MSSEVLAKVYSSAKEMDSDFQGTQNDEKKTFIIKLTLRIAHACEQENDFIAAVLHHNYPPIPLSQVEAEFLRTGELPVLLEAEPHIFAV